jgi:hypothetical protein
MRTPQLDRIATEGCRLLLGVARLGDRDLRGWWNSSAMDNEVGQFVLSNTFPRTARLVGAELALMSAARRHSQVLDRPNAIHLFSDRMHFHRWTKAWLSEQKTSVVDGVVGEIEGWSDVDAASKTLAEWAGVATPLSEAVVGALNLGRVPSSELKEPERELDLARRFASCYATMDQFTPPYVNVSET